VIEHTIQTTTHGRYLVAASAPSSPLIVGFHGYAESADTQMTRLQAIHGLDAWTAISVQGMHRFYERRTDTVVASWMTRQDRELAIADNVAYVAAIIDAESNAHQAATGVVYAGFSQGVAMAFRAAVTSARPVLGLIAAGGDVPPEIDRSALGRVGHVLLCRGAEDKWYTEATFEHDQARLRDAGVKVTAHAFDGGHEWSDAVVAAAAGFLKDRRR
jgi:predicted esterase